MNIYISKDNENNLRSLDDWTMSGLINHLLNEYFEKNPKSKSEKTADGKILEIPECCKLSKPCRHWSYDGTTQTWTNTLTGQTKEVSY